MHELSIVMNIVSIAEEESRKNNVDTIEEIEIDIGELSGIEMPAFEFAWQQAIKSTVLEKSVATINRISGEGQCMNCEATFPLSRLYDPCPVCGDYFIQVTRGKELRVKSLVVS